LLYLKKYENFDFEDWDEEEFDNDNTYIIFSSGKINFIGYITKDKIGYHIKLVDYKESTYSFNIINPMNKKKRFNKYRTNKK